MIGTVQAIGKGGQGIVRQEGKTVFIPGVLAGEVIEYALGKERQSVCSGTLERLIEPSPWRQRPCCPHYADCGGCNFQHIRYEEQLRIKERIFRDNLSRIAGIDWRQPLTVVASPPWRYRTKTEFKIVGGKVGFFRRQSHELVEIGSCQLVPRVVEDLLRSASLRNRVETVAFGRILALTDGRSVSAYIADSKDEKNSPGPTGIPFSISVPSGRRYEYDFDPGNFIQANIFLLPVMIGLLEESLIGLSPATASDLFCGTGFFTLPLAAHAGQVLAVENNPVNLVALRRNLERNKAGNVTMSAADAYSADILAADVFVVDPPRGGLGKKMIGRMTAAGPQIIVYYSCDSATFARDIRFFSKAGYVPKVMRLIDNFPQTDHFEIFTALEKGGG